MPTLSPIRSGQLFVGADTLLRITVTGTTLTGQALRWTLRRNAAESGGALVSKTTGAGTITLDGASTAVVDIDAADTAGLLPGVYQHSLIRTDAGSVMVLSYGWAVLDKAAGP